MPQFDGNPERLRVDSDGQIGATRLEVPAGALLSNVTGPLDFGFRTWTILPDPGTLTLPPAVPVATPVPVPDATEFTVGSFNLERFFDDVNDPAIPSSDEPVLTSTAFGNRLSKASLAIRGLMRTPDILGVEAVENLSTPERLASRLNDDAASAGEPNPAYQAYLAEGNDVGGIDVGFLIKSSRVAVLSVTQEGKEATYINPNNGLPETLNDRPPLVLRAAVQGPAGALPVAVIVNHLRSLSGIDDELDDAATPASDPPGPRVRAKRRAQAEFLANLIQARQAADPNERIISIGDYNAFQVNDGYVSGSVDPHAVGHYTRTYSVSNGYLTTTMTRDVNVVDTTAPIVVLAGSNPMTIEVGGGFADPGATANDTCAGDLTGAITTTGAINAGVVGTYQLTYSVSDGFNLASATRTVFVVDTTPPVLSVVAPSPSSLWPPNHKMATVTLAYSVLDNSDGAACSIGVTSDEPVDGAGDGDTSPDWAVVDAHTVRLRAERAGRGDGRVYAVTVTCRDATGNASVASTVVTVPKSRGK